MTISQLPKCEGGAINLSNLCIQWDKLSSSKIEYYEICAYEGLCNIVLLDGVKCTYANCHDHSHTADMETFYDDIINVLSKSGGQIIKQVLGNRLGVIYDVV